MHNVTNKKYVPWGNSAAGVASPSFSSAFSASMCSRTAGAHRFLKPIHLKKCYWKFNIFYIDIALNSNLVPHWFFYLWNFVVYLIRYMLDMKNKNTLRKIERRFIQKNYEQLNLIIKRACKGNFKQRNQVKIYVTRWFFDRSNIK